MSVQTFPSHCAPNCRISALKKIQTIQINIGGIGVPNSQVARLHHGLLVVMYVHISKEDEENECWI